MKLNVTITRQADYFFVSFKQEADITKVKGIEDKSIVGVDVGISTLATMSDGKIAESVKSYSRNKRRLRIAQRVVSKRFNKEAAEQSNNYKKAKKKVEKIHYRVSCIRKDSLHKLTTNLAKNHSLIGIEDLNVKGMMKNHRLASAISDGGFFEFRRQLEYKTKWYGSKLFVIDRYFPSSKMCSCCGNIKKDLKLSQRVYECENCGLSLGRDLNAAINIRNEAESSYASVCGEFNKTDNHVSDSVKQKSKQQNTFR
jgi:putative transposase